MAPPLLATFVSRLRFRHLRLIDALYRGGSLHRVASEMHMTQPAATKILQDAENLMGAQLFERRARGMTPTEIGTFVADYAARLLRETESFAEGLDNLKAGGFGALAIGAIMATTPGLLPRAVAELKQRRRLITTRLLAATSDILLDALSRNEIAVAIARFTEPADAIAFDIEPLASEELWIFTAADHPLAREQSLTLAETARLAWVLQPKSSPMRKLLDSTFASLGISSLDNCVETTSIFATLNLVRDAGMVACLPKSILVEGVTRGTFSRLPIAMPNQLGPLGIITRRGETLSANAADFIDVLRAMKGAAPPQAEGEHPDR